MQVMPDQGAIGLELDRVFAALGDATRRDIVRRAIAGDEGVAELATHYAMSFAAVQKHIAVLERAGLITKERAGRRKIVRTRVEAVRGAQRALDRYEALWLQRIDRMTELLSQPLSQPPSQPSSQPSQHREESTR
jgi:DNA-binding transcriptional ArsR family regulator